jgi:hypothetical protein
VKALTLFVLTCFMMVHTELHELFTVPALVVHYINHKKENPKENILNFLSEHYSTESDHSHSEEHKKLPFKHAKIVNGTLLTVIQSFNLVFMYHITRKMLVFIIHKADLPDLMLSKGIWQPPKNCSFF